MDYSKKDKEPDTFLGMFSKLTFVVFDEITKSLSKEMSKGITYKSKKRHHF